MRNVYESDHLWISYISFNLFRLLFPDYIAEDWFKVTGCFEIRIRPDPWIKVRRCAAKPAYRQDLSKLGTERAEINKEECAGSKEVVVYQEGKERKEEGIKEDIGALMAGVRELNWDVDPVEEDTTQLMNLRRSLANKIQKTLSFDL